MIPGQSNIVAAVGFSPGHRPRDGRDCGSWDMLRRPIGDDLVRLRLATSYDAVQDMPSRQGVKRVLVADTLRTFQTLVPEHTYGQHCSVGLRGDERTWARRQGIQCWLPGPGRATPGVQWDPSLGHARLVSPGRILLPCRRVERDERQHCASTRCHRRAGSENSRTHS